MGVDRENNRGKVGEQAGLLQKEVVLKQRILDYRVVVVQPGRRTGT